MAKTLGRQCVAPVISSCVSTDINKEEGEEVYTEIGFYDNNFGQEVCSTCHLFLLSTDINTEEGEDVNTEVGFYGNNFGQPLCSSCHQR